ncbi:MAG: SDR family NAD(P)-dependent oxidoreductase [Ruminococcaceae bacterium]|nr:SDR family NAD(P)-dependent oxidoreductase [Oscillospiraceae bacterium]
MRIAVITGASSGMGREFVRQIAEYERFDEVWVIARRAERLLELQKECPFPVRAVSLDLSREESFETYCALLEAEQPQIGLLINCAGYGKFGRVDELSLPDQLGMIDLNAKALTAVTNLSLPYLHAGDKVLQLDSLSAFQPVPYLAVYGATKAYVLSYSRALNAELKKQGIRVLAVSPGWVQTEFFDRAMTPGNDAVTYFNKVYSADFVVKKALCAMYRTKKDLCIPGLPVWGQTLLVKLLPHRLVMRIWLKQQKH